MLHQSFSLLLVLLGFSAAQRGPACPAPSPLPIVDLGYELHQAASYNRTGEYYSFTNIRYAAPPLGELRFAAPQKPAVDRSKIQTGKVARICPQAAPMWGLTAAEFLSAYLTGQPYNASTASSPGNSSTPPPLPSLDPRTSEDCLFLDVLVPKKVFRATGKGCGAPVLVWIYGGGYTAGYKNAYGNPAGLLAASESQGNEGMIYVALNYRLGAFGFLGGPTVQAKGTANAGLHDQRLALEWIQENIHLFGGDPKKVTIMGESAGGGSVIHQITAYGGKRGPVPFQQAIPQSPGWRTVPDGESEAALQQFLSLLNVSTIEEARQLPSERLIQVNALQIGRYATYGTQVYGPTVDGDFVPDLPDQLLLQGKFDSSVRVMAGFNGDEGLYFTPPSLADEARLAGHVRSLLPSISDSALQTVTQDLYPPVYDGSYPFRDAITRAALVISEMIFTCHTIALDLALQNRTHVYSFTEPPALHGQDIPYTFFNGVVDTSDAGNVLLSLGVSNSTVAYTLQAFIASFTMKGWPEGLEGVPQFDMYGAESIMFNLNSTNLGMRRDPNANGRCRWWLEGSWW